MSDDTAKRSPQDASKISLREDYEVRYWTEKFAISREQLEAAVAQAGNGAAAVAAYLQGGAH
jgi:hypothetical protein